MIFYEGKRLIGLEGKLIIGYHGYRSTGTGSLQLNSTALES